MLQKRSEKHLTQAEFKRLISHSPEAVAYSKAIDILAKEQNKEQALPQMTIAQLDVIRANLEKLTLREDFRPRYTYGTQQSNKNLLLHGYFQELKVTDLSSFARLLSDEVKPADWVEFVNAVDGNFLYKLFLPMQEEKQPPGTVLRDGPNGKVLVMPGKTVELMSKTDARRPAGNVEFYTPEWFQVLQRADGSIYLLKPDLSQLSSEKFDAFIEKQNCSGDVESVYNKALMLLLTNLYKRARHNESKFAGTVGKMTGLAPDREKKEDAASALERAMAAEGYLINQVPKYLKDTGGTVHLAAMKGGRLGALLKKAYSLGPGIRESAENLGKLVEILSKSPLDSWVAMMATVPENTLQQYVDTSGGFINFVKGQKYVEGNEKYNKAILYILGVQYSRNREKEQEHTGFLGSFSYSKKQKTAAINAYLNFLTSKKKPTPEQIANNTPESELPEYSLNELHQYLVDVGKEELEPIMREVWNHFSKLGTLVAQGGDGCHERVFSSTKEFVAENFRIK